MGAFTYIETDTGSNVNIASATAVGAYTATGDKLIMVDVSIDQVAGNGDYVMYVKRQIGGSGSAYVILPKTTMAAASGETAISAQSGWITVRNGDVLTCYVDGLAGDTTTPDWSTRWFELAGVTAAAVADAVWDEALSGHTAAGSGGEQLAFAAAQAEEANQFAQLASADTSAIIADTNELQTDLVNGGRLDLLIDSIITHLTAIKGAGWTDQTLIKIVGDIATMATAANLAALDGKVDSILEDTGTTLDTLIKDIPTNTELATALGTADDAVLAALAAAKAVIDNIHDTDLPAVKAETALIVEDTGTTLPATLATIAGYTDGIAGDVWSYPNRSLTVSSARPRTLVEGDNFSIYKDTSITIPITGLGDISGYTNLWFTIKREQDLESADTQSIVHMDYLTGLLYINKAAATSGHGSITLDDPALGCISVVIRKDGAALLPVYAKESLRWEVKGIAGSVVDILLQGTCYIQPAVSRKIA